MQRTRSGRKILVVDDEIDVLRSVHDLLRIDYEVLTCQHGNDAIERLKEDADIAVILSDQRMPGMSGVELLQQARLIRPETTRLLFTAYADLHAVIDAINQGHVFRYITKPWEPDELDSVVRQAVERYDLVVEKNTLLTELQTANSKLTEAIRLKGLFLEVASHELNTPVTVILGLTDLWKLSLKEDSASSERQWVERINGAARRLARIVQRMLLLVKHNEFDNALDLQTVHLEPLLKGAIEELSPYLEVRGQSVEVQVDPQVGPIEADSSKIVDVLINLLANAIKFTPDGGTIRAVVVPEDRDWVRVIVSDQGVGVHPSEQQYLFEPFFTGFDTLHHSSGDYQFGKRGIGLGLCLVKTFVELHGGRVEVQSSPERGSSFAFLLPRRQPATNRPAPEQNLGVPAGVRDGVPAISDSSTSPTQPCVGRSMGASEPGSWFR